MGNRERIKQDLRNVTIETKDFPYKSMFNARKGGRASLMLAAFDHTAYCVQYDVTT
jgi:hypothetical protein